MRYRKCSIDILYLARMGEMDRYLELKGVYLHIYMTGLKVFVE